MAKMHPLYLQQKNERYLRKKLEKSKQKDIDDEADWRRKLSPKRSDYSLKVSVLAFEYNYTLSRRPWVLEDTHISACFAKNFSLTILFYT